MKKRILFLSIFFLAMIGLLVAITAAYRSASFPSGNSADTIRSHNSLERKASSNIANGSPKSIPTPKSSSQTIQHVSLTVCVTMNPPGDKRNITIRLRNDEREIGSKEIISSPTDAIQCVFSPLDTGVAYTVIASASEYLSTQHTATLSEKENSLALVLYHHLILSLVIVNETAQRVPGAEIDIRSKSQGLFSQQVQANEKGEADIELPYPGDYDLIVHHPLYTESVHQVLRIYGNPNHRTITLSGKTGMIYGKAFNETGDVISGASVTLLRSTKHNRFARQTTDPDGRYRFESLPLSEYYITIDAGDAYINSDIEYSMQSKQDRLFPHVVLTPEKPIVEIDFPLYPAPQIHGLVVDSTNNPVTGATIKAGIQGNRPTSIHSIFKEIHSGSRGEFTFPIQTRIKGWTTLCFAAIHPYYGYTTESIENFIDPSKITKIVLKMDQQFGGFKASVVTSRSREPIADIALTFVPVDFQDEKQYHKIVKTDTQGNLQISLPALKYLVKADGYTIQSPQSIVITPNQEIKTTLFLEKNDEKKVTIAGIVVDQDHTPIHGAQIHINKENLILGGTESSPEGKFSFQVNESDLQEEQKISIYHRHYRFLEIPIQEIPDLNGIIAELEDNAGAIKVTLTHIENVQGLVLRLYGVDPPYETGIEKEANQPVIFFRNIDENKGPYYIMAGDETHAGISPIFDLRDVQSRYVEIEIPIRSIENRSSLSIQVLDIQTNEPLSIATCEIIGNTFNPAGIPSLYQKKAITFPSGIATFKDIPLCIGTLRISHVFYREKLVPFIHDGVNLDPVQTIKLSRRNITEP